MTEQEAQGASGGKLWIYKEKKFLMWKQLKTLKR